MDKYNDRKVHKHSDCPVPVRHTQLQVPMAIMSSACEFVASTRGLQAGSHRKGVVIKVGPWYPSLPKLQLLNRRGHPLLLAT